MIHVGEFILGDEERSAILNVLNSGRITEGEKVRQFERLFAEYIGTRYAVVVNSGTSALITGLLALDSKLGLKKEGRNKVITSPLTYIADANAITLSGLEPVFVDVDCKTFGITPDTIRTHLESVNDPEAYSILLPVHLMGYPCDMDEISKIAKEYDLRVFEDSAQAHGSKYHGKMTGSMSDISIFSFYVAHNIQVGEMGAVVTNDPELYRLVKKIKANGRMCDCPVCKRAEGKCPYLLHPESFGNQDPRFCHDMVGYNFKVMEFQPALGILQLQKADQIMRKRLENVDYLNKGLAKFSDILTLPKYDENVSYLAYPIVIEKPDRISRSDLQRELELQGVETRPLFGCIPTQQKSFEHLKGVYDGKLPNADYLGKNAFYIGCHQYLSKKDLDYIIKTFESVIA